MAFSLRNLFRRNDAPAAGAPVAEPAEEPETVIECQHTVLRAHWEDAANLGNEDLASSWICEACGVWFSPEKAAALRATEADRLKQELSLSGQSQSEAPSES